MAVKYFNVAALSPAHLISPHKVGYQDSIDIIFDELHKTRKSFIKIGWYLKHINEENMYEEEGYENIYQFAHDKFNISQPTATRFMNLCIEFSVNHDSPELDEKYIDFNVSQLFEMLPMKQEEKEQITPDMTVKEIRTVKSENRRVAEPDDGEIRLFYQYCLKGITAADRNNLKDYMLQNYGKGHAGGSIHELDYKCSPRGIRINHSKEITWTSFVKRVNELIPLEAEAIEDDNLPGQMSIEKDFQEYMPDSVEENENPSVVNSIPSEEKYATSHISDTIVDGEYREVEVAKSESTSQNSTKGSSEAKETKEISTDNEESLRDEIEELADGVKEFFGGWEGQEIPKDELEVAKKNVIRLAILIEQLLNIK